HVLPGGELGASGADHRTREAIEQLCAEPLHQGSARLSADSEVSRLTGPVMKKKTRRRRVDVNVEELDRIIDEARSAPLSEADSQKLKTALHALAERLLPHPQTEKTSAVFGEAETPPPEDLQPESESASGHGRNGAAAYRGAKKVPIPHAKLSHADRCPECTRAEV